MNGSKALLDSNTIIDDSKEIIDINRIIEKYSLVYLSIISYIEIMGYPFENENEREAIINILKKIPLINLNIEIADKAIEYRTHYKIKLPDALILATASHLKADLITSNLNDFKKIDNTVKIIVPLKNL